MNYLARAAELRAKAAGAKGRDNWALRLAAVHFEAAASATTLHWADYHARHGEERAKEAGV